MANIGGNRRHRGQTLGQRLEVKAGTADDDRGPVQRLRFVERRAHIDEPAADGIILRRIDMTVKAMGHARLFLDRGTGRDDAQVAIDLHGIRIDDDAAGPWCFGNRQCVLRLAAGGRACDENGITEGHAT
jgi:hypothetical protein